MMELKLELVLIPVADVDRAKAFYTEKIGFNLDVDTRPTEGFRVVQMSSRGRRARSPSARHHGCRPRF
jgi:catechol 2,3-dioxygenase-like lactoylglutathione lyase family enzyme